MGLLLYAVVALQSCQSPDRGLEGLGLEIFTKPMFLVRTIKLGLKIGYRLSYTLSVCLSKACPYVKTMSVILLGHDRAPSHHICHIVYL